MSAIYIMGFALFLGIIITTILFFKLQVQLKLALILSILIGLCTGTIFIVFNQLGFDLKFIFFVFEAILYLSLLTGFILFRFYRDPERQTPEKQNIIVSPADGTIRYIHKIKKGVIPFSEKKGNTYLLNEFSRSDLLENGGILIGIEMNIFDVHVNRSPVAGKVLLIQPSKGFFLSLRLFEAIMKNERITTIIDQGTFKVGVVQIASRLVRRIITYIHNGAAITMGQRIGAIRFGSQVDLFIPSINNLKFTITRGDHVKAGITILAEY